MGLIAERIGEPLRRGDVGRQWMYWRHHIIILNLVVAVEDVEAFLHGDALVSVGCVAVAVNHAEHGVHRGTCGLAQVLAVEQMADEDGREYVARAMKEPGNLMILQVEIGIIVMVVAHHGILPLDLTTGNEQGLTADAAHPVYQLFCLHPRDAFHLDGGIGEITGLGIVGEGEVGHADHLPHEFHLTFGHAIVEPSAIAEDGIDEDGGAQCALFSAIASHEFGLFLAEHQARADGVEAEAQFLPDGQGASDIVGGVLDIKLPVVECVRHEGCGQAIGRNPQVRQDRQHGSHAHLAVAHYIID